MDSIQYLWKDRKRYFGLPLSFTRFRLSEDRLFLEKGFLNINIDEVLLYRVRDLEVNLKLSQRIFGVGTVMVHSSDKSVPVLELTNIKQPREVKEMIHKAVEEAKLKRQMRTMEIMGEGGEGTDGHDDSDLDFLDDFDTTGE